MAPARGVERRNAHKTVHAVLAFQIPIGVFALNEDIGRLDARFFAVEHVEHLDLKAAALAPADIHPVQHQRPVLRFRPARAGVERDNRGQTVVFAGEHGVERELLHLAFQRCQFGENFVAQPVLVLLNRHGDQRKQVGCPRGKAAIAFELGL